MAAVDIWYRARKLIERRLDRGTYAIHFRGTYLIDDADGMIIVEADSARVLSSLSRVSVSGRSLLLRRAQSARFRPILSFCEPSCAGVLNVSAFSTGGKT